MSDIVQPSRQDVAYLEALADIDHYSDSQTIPDDSLYNEYDLDDHVFDSFMDEAGMTPFDVPGDKQMSANSSPKSIKDLRSSRSPLPSSQLPVRSRPIADFATNTNTVQPETAEDDEEITTNSRSPARLKRVASSQELRPSQNGSKPAKLNKSFSEGVDPLVDSESPKFKKSAQHEGDLSHERTGSASYSQLSQALADEEEIQALQYTIPLKVLIGEKRKNQAVCNPVAFWSHKLYSDRSGNSVEVEYCKTKTESEAAARKFLNESMVGFDMEWVARPWQSKKLTGIKRQVCVIQVASESRIALFHIALHEGTAIRDLIAPSLRKILESGTIVKTGVSVASADGKRLKRYFGINCQALVELSRLHQVLTNANRGRGHVKNISHGLAKLVEEYLELPLYKGDTRTSDWGRPLDAKQILYAAADAYAGYMLYRVMEIKRLRLSPMPPRALPEDFGIPLTAQIDAWYDAREAEEAEEAKKAEAAGAPEETEETSSTTAAAPSEGSSELAREADPPDDIPDPREEVLFQALCEHRKLQTAGRGIRPASIASDKLLRTISSVRPTNHAALLTTPGANRYKVRNYGKEWLRIITEHDYLWNKQPAPLPADFHQQDAALYDRLLSALQLLSLKLRGAIDSSTLEQLARIKPRTMDALSCIDGARQFSDLADAAGISLLEYIKDEQTASSAAEAPARTVTSSNLNVQCTESDSDESDCFETMLVPGTIEGRTPITKYIV